jgi:hypothetical protein
VRLPWGARSNPVISLFTSLHVGEEIKTAK